MQPTNSFDPGAHPRPPPRSRLAPTPSGLLHLGNGVNFVITWLLVRWAGGRLRLRIDDVDHARTRREFVEDIFHQLDWLGLDWDEGPTGPDEFFARFSQGLRRERYREVLADLRRRGCLYMCSCSRRELRQQGGCCSCRRRRGASEGEHAWRVRLPRQWSVRVGDRLVTPRRELGDCIVWRRDDLPAYQLVSLVDDMDNDISLVVRGADLRSSTAAQLFLAEQLGANGFLSATFIHHPLLICPGGKKLSKSDDALALAAMRRAGATPVVVFRETARLLGLPPDAGESLTALADGLAAGRFLEAHMEFQGGEATP